MLLLPLVDRIVANIDIEAKSHSIRAQVFTMLLPLHLLSLSILASLVSAHGDVGDEFEARRRFLQVHTNNLDHCEGIHEAAIQTRADTVAALHTPSRTNS